LVSKEVNNAEHEDMNIRPPPPIIELAAPLKSADKKKNKKQRFTEFRSAP
jgi:hypothetical protein